MPKFTLKTPITVFDAETQTEKTLSDITLREPTTDDYLKLGDPYVMGISGGGSLSPKPAVVKQYICELGGLMPSQLKTIDLADFINLQGWVVNFFMEKLGQASN
jgi:hypothetical protein